MDRRCSGTRWRRQADGEVIFTDALYWTPSTGKPVITMAQMGKYPWHCAGL